MRLFAEPARRALALLVVTLLLASPAAAADRLASMLNEDLLYDVSFLWFKRLAEARIRLQPGAVAGTFVASLVARTRGLSAFVTRNRRSRYETTMELVDGRFRPLRHEKVGSRGSGDGAKHRRTIYEFDYERREIRFRKTKTGNPDREEIRPMPEQPLSDVLTAFYNLRAGFMGPMVADVEYRLPTMVGDEEETLTIQVLGDTEREAHDDFPDGGYLCRVAVGREVFGSEDGTVFVWFDDAGRPGRTVVKDVLALGDVTGTLKGMGPAGDVPGRAADRGGGR